MSDPALAQLLEERRAALEALPGVIGTAIGAHHAGSEQEAIHVYVTRQADASRVRSEAERMLGDVPVETIEMDMPAAQSD